LSLSTSGTISFCFIVLSQVLVPACGSSGDGEKRTQTPQRFGGEANSEGDIAIPPDDYYACSEDEDALSLANDFPETLYLNFNGATVTRGLRRGQSFVPCQNESVIPPAGLSAADEERIVEIVQDLYDGAKANLKVTTDQPTSGNFTIIHVGGLFSTLGCNKQGVLGVAPLDIGNRNRNDVGFAFLPRGISNLMIGQTIAHEAAHSFGLDHVEERRDLMFPALTASVEGFKASPKSNGGTQDGPALLRQALGTQPDKPKEEQPEEVEQARGGNVGSGASANKSNSDEDDEASVESDARSSDAKAKSRSRSKATSQCQ
jgi:hypothetical protein